MLLAGPRMSDPPSATRSGKVALVGRPNVGKSTLLNALLGEPIAITSPHPQTTREPVRGILTAGDTQVVFVDTPGLHAARTRLGERMNRAARDQASEADAIVLVAEVHAGGGSPASGPYEEDLALARELGRLPAVLVLNKVDRVKDKTRLLPVIESFAAAHAFAAIVPLVARRADGVERLVAELRKVLPEQPFLFEADTLSDQPVRFFVAEFVREQILQHTRQEVPHGVAVVVERFDEGTDVPHIELTVHVARESHKKILVGARGRMMKSIGTAARARVEQMLGKKVHLRLWVRTTPDWMNDPAKLRELGYGGDSTAKDDA
jgi:GTP-binding protein Era